MSLPLPAVERLFHRLVCTYGAQFSRLYDGLTLDDVKTAWAHELAAYAGRLEAIAWALEHLPERAPNAIAFKALCQQAPRPEPVAVLTGPEPKADPERLRGELAKLQALRDSFTTARPGRRLEWAERILRRVEAGDRKVLPVAVSIARAALGVQAPAPAEV